MKSIFDSRFARSVTVTDGIGNHTVRAFLRPISVQSPEMPELSPAGVRDERRWRIILPPLTRSGQVTVTDGDTDYLLLRFEEIGGGDHIEGLLCRKAGDPNAE